MYLSCADDGTPVCAPTSLIATATARERRVASRRDATGRDATRRDATRAQASTNVLHRTSGWPSAEDVLAFLGRVMAAPRVLNASMRGQAKCSPGRPQRVALCSTPDADALRGQPERWAAAGAALCPYVVACAPRLAAVGIECAWQPAPEFVLQTAVPDIERRMVPPEHWGTPQLPGLAEAVDGWTPRFGRSLFAAAAELLASGAHAAVPRGAALRVSYRFQIQPGVAARVVRARSAPLQLRNFY